MRTSKKNIQLLILFLLLCGVSGCLSQDISDYHLNQLNFPTQVSTQIQHFEELSNSYSIGDVSEELCFHVPQYVGDTLSPDDPEVCYPFCFINRETHELSCMIQNPFWRLENNQPFRLRLSAEREVSYSPSMTIQQLVDLAGEEEPQKKEDKTLDKSPVDSDNDCAEGEIWNDTTETCDPEIIDGGEGGEGGGGGDEILCTEACEVGYFCNTAIGECEATPDENLCEDVVCDPGQFCDDTGACVDDGEDPEGEGDRPPGTNRRSNDTNDPPAPVNSLACAYNPASCGDTKGWCSLNPEAGFNPFIFVILVLPLLGLIMRVVKNTGGRKFLSEGAPILGRRTEIS